MVKLIAFEQISLDGFFADAQGDMNWAHKSDPEWNAFAAENARGGGTLMFGRVTFEMMASFWPTPAARRMAPVVAERMNTMPKVVFSRTIQSSTWSNTEVVCDDMLGRVRALKRESKEGIAIMGSGSIVMQLAEAGLIDEFQFVIDPIALGSGRTLFAGISRQIAMKRLAARTFENGNVVLTYEPVR